MNVQKYVNHEPLSEEELGQRGSPDGADTITNENWTSGKMSALRVMIKTLSI